MQDVSVGTTKPCQTLVRKRKDDRITLTSPQSARCTLFCTCSWWGHLLGTQTAQSTWKIRSELLFTSNRARGTNRTMLCVRKEARGVAEKCRFSTSMRNDEAGFCGYLWPYGHRLVWEQIHNDSLLQMCSWHRPNQSVASPSGLQQSHRAHGVTALGSILHHHGTLRACLCRGRH